MSDPLTRERIEELRRIAEAARSVEQLPLEQRTAPEHMWAAADFSKKFTPPTVLALLYEIERLRREREVLAEAVMAREQASNVEGMAHGAMVQSLTEQLKVDQWRRLAQENDLKAHEAALALLDGEKGGGGE